MASIAAHKSSWKSDKHAGQWAATLETYAYPVHWEPSGAAGRDCPRHEDHRNRSGNSKTETASRVRGRIEKSPDRAKAPRCALARTPAALAGRISNQLARARNRQVSPVEKPPGAAYAELPEFMTKLRAKEGVSARALEFTILTIARTGDTIGASASGDQQD